MDNKHTSNKMINMEDKETKIRFNLAMHGYKKDQIVHYTSESTENKLFIRRRLADNDGFVEVVMDPPKPKPQAEPVVEVTSKNKHKNKNKSNDGKSDANSNKQGDN